MVAASAAIFGEACVPPRCPFYSRGERCLNMFDSCFFCFFFFSVLASTERSLHTAPVKIMLIG